MIPPDSAAQHRARGYQLCCASYHTLLTYRKHRIARFFCPLEHQRH